MARLVHIHVAEPLSKHKMPLIAQEQAVVTNDLLVAANVDVKDWQGPFALRLELVDQHLVFEFTCNVAGECHKRDIPVKDVKKIVKDYGMMVDAYEAGRHSLTPDRLEAIDMGRRALHNEGSEIVSELLQPDVNLDHETARRLFTLISIVLIGHNVS